MSRLFMPRATSLSTSISRSVSLGGATCWRLLLLGVALGQRRELGEQLARHRGVDQGLAAVHRADRLGHLVQRDVLQQVAAGARPDRLEQVLFLVADRQDHDLRAGRDLLDGAARLDATALRHPDVHEHDVGQRFAGHGHRLGPVARLPDQVDVVLLVEDHLQAAPEQRVVIRDQYADGLQALGPSHLPIPLLGPPSSSHRPVAHGAQLRCLPRGHRPPRPDQAAGLTMTGRVRHVTQTLADPEP